MLWSHWKRNLGRELNHRDLEKKKRQYQRRRSSQALFDVNYINSRLAHNAKIRLQFLGIRIAEPPNSNDVVSDAQPFDNVMVSQTVQRVEYGQRRHDVLLKRSLSFLTIRSDPRPPEQQVGIPETERIHRCRLTPRSLLCRIPTLRSTTSKGRTMSPTIGTSEQSWKEESSQAGTLSTTALQEDCTAIGGGVPSLRSTQSKNEMPINQKTETHLWWYSMCRSWTSFVKEAK